MSKILAILGGTIAALIGNSLLTKLSTLNVNVIHAMPGRIRLQCNTWKNEALVKTLMETMNEQQLIAKVECSSITGSMVIYFKEQYLTSQQFQGVVETAVKATRKGMTEKKSEATASMVKAMNAVNRQVKVSTKGMFDIPALIILALTIHSLKTFSINRGNALRQLLWAYRILKGEGARHLD